MQGIQQRLFIKALCQYEQNIFSQNSYITGKLVQLLQILSPTVCRYAGPAALFAVAEVLPVHIDTHTVRTDSWREFSKQLQNSCFNAFRRNALLTDMFGKGPLLNNL